MIDNERHFFDIRKLRPVLSGRYEVFTKSGKNLFVVYNSREDSWDMPDGEKISNWAFPETGKDILAKSISR